MASHLTQSRTVRLRIRLGRQVIGLEHMTGNKHEAKHLLKDHLYRAFRLLRVTISAGRPACRCYMDRVENRLVVGRNIWKYAMTDNAAMT